MREIRRRAGRSTDAFLAVSRAATRRAAARCRNNFGGVWANYSWGRFWGWDPKETWALIALLCYITTLHGRLAGWWTQFGLVVASVVCFLAVLMAWYGVNFVLGKGLHSYGFGIGGETYVATFVVLDLLFVGFAIWRYRTSKRARTVAQTDARPLPV